MIFFTLVFIFLFIIKKKQTFQWIRKENLIKMVKIVERFIEINEFCLSFEEIYVKLTRNRKQGPIYCRFFQFSYCFNWIFSIFLLFDRYFDYFWFRENFQSIFPSSMGWPWFFFRVFIVSFVAEKRIKLNKQKKQRLFFEWLSL